MSLSFEIVTPRGRALTRDGIVEIVFRRREERFEQGSEVAVFRGHAPMLMQSAAGPIRWRDTRDVEHHCSAGPGLVEVVGDQVLLVADVAEPGTE